MTHQSSQFEQISLPPILLAGLFSQSLVVIKDDGAANRRSQKINDAVVERDIFREELSVPTEVAEPATDSLLQSTIQERLSWLGGFNKNVLVLVEDKNNLHLGEGDLDLLSKMLQALKLSLADVAVVNCATQQVKWSVLISELVATHIIFFGVDPSSIEVPIRLPHFRVHSWSNSKFLYSPSLMAINTVSSEQTTLKKELWKALQEMFTQ